MNTLAGTNDPLGIPEEPETGPGEFDGTVGESMFETMGKPPSFAPTAAEMAKAMEDVKRVRKVELKEVVSRTYDLSNDTQRAQYVNDLEHIMVGVNLKTHVLLDRPPKQFVADALGARYVAYLEWAEFRMVEKAAPVTGEQT